MSRRVFTFLAVVAVVFATMAPASAAALPERSSAPDHVLDLKLSSPITNRTLDASLTGVTGEQQVIVRLSGPSVGETKTTGKAAKAEKGRVEAEQADFLSRVRAFAPEATVVARVQHVLNAVFLRVDAASLPRLSADPAVTRIVPVADYDLDLFETVPYIGASAVQGMGFDGSGVRVAVLDSGIDYTHAALGGSGNPADYAGNDPTIVEPGTFPTAKVVGGYDFVGSAWFGGAGSPPEAPDADPLDDGPGSGHGTHVGHIIGGAGGVAPGVDLYAVKVCSSISTSCSGIALIQGMEFAVDPDGDGDTSDAVDVINMSLGSPYGQPFDDDLSLAVDNASALGVLTVASAGNSADKPFIVGSPSATSTALSVAQTQVPSAALQLISDGTNDYPAVFQPWSTPLAGLLSGPGQYGDGAGGNLNGCAPFAPGSLAGKIVLVDRGACNFTLKVKNVGDAGGLVGIIGLVAPGAPFSGGDGGDAPITIPGYMIGQAESNALKAGIGGGGITITVDPNNQLPLIGQMVGSSSRGPQLQDIIIKPEIGAPGASVSAIAGTGTGMGPFGGTSGAAPMVSGSVALLLQAEPGLSPAEAKARLVNTGDTSIDTDPFVGAAPVTRIGGGEVRIDQALSNPLAAWDDDTLLPTLSFGFVDVAKGEVKLKKKVRVSNYGLTDATLDVIPTFRFANDEASGAVEVKVPDDVKVKAGKSKTFDVEITIHGDLLAGNSMNSGGNGANPAVLDLDEFDGYLMLDGGPGMTIHVPWHVLPRKAAEVKASKDIKFKDGVGEVKLDNKGVGTAQVDGYSLLYVSPDLPAGTRGDQSPVPDLRAVGINTFPVPAGFCSGQPSFLWAFAINTWERQTTAAPAPAYYSVFLDTDQDGTDDYEVFNFDLSLSSSLSDGRNVVWAVDLATGLADAWFFTEHSTVTGNTIMYICGEQVGLTGTDMLSTNVDMTVVAWDWYFTGDPTDVMGPFTVTPLGEQYVAFPSDLAPDEKADIPIVDFGAFPGNTQEAGVLLVTNGDRGAGARGGATEDTEGLIIPSKDFKKEVKKVLKTKIK